MTSKGDLKTSLGSLHAKVSIYVFTCWLKKTFKDHTLIEVMFSLYKHLNRSDIYYLLNILQILMPRDDSFFALFFNFLQMCRSYMWQKIIWKQVLFQYGQSGLPLLSLHFFSFTYTFCLMLIIGHICNLWFLFISQNT